MVVCLVNPYRLTVSGGGGGGGISLVSSNTTVIPSDGAGPTAVSLNGTASAGDMIVVARTLDSGDIETDAPIASVTGRYTSTAAPTTMLEWIVASGGETTISIPHMPSAANGYAPTSVSLWSSMNSTQHDVPILESGSFAQTWVWDEITPVTDAALIMAIGSVDDRDSDPVPSPPASVDGNTVLLSHGLASGQSTGSNNGSSLVVYAYILPTAGATTPTSVDTNAANDGTTRLTIAWRPA